MQTLSAEENSCTVIAMVTTYYSPYSECIGSQLTTSSHIVYCTSGMQSILGERERFYWLYIVNELASQKHCAHTHTHTQQYRNPRCACTPRVNYASKLPILSLSQAILYHRATYILLLFHSSCSLPFGLIPIRGTIVFLDGVCVDMSLQCS